MRNLAHIISLQKVDAGDEQEADEKRDTIEKLSEKIESLKKMSIRTDSITSEADHDDVLDEDTVSEDEVSPAGEGT